MKAKSPQHTGLVKGPAALAERLIEARAELKKTLRQATTNSEKNQIKCDIAALTLALRVLRRRRTQPKMYYELDDLSDRARTMTRLLKSLGRGREVIYHGTRDLPGVMRLGKLLPPIWAESGVFFTRSAEVAAYFAYLMGEKKDQRSPGVLILDKDSLRQCYRLEPYRYDPSNDRNEREEVIWCRIINFRRHLVGAVSDANVSAVLGPPKRRYLPQGFARWPDARRQKFNERKGAAGRRFVRRGRADVRQLIVREREAHSRGAFVIGKPKRPRLP